MRAARQRSLAEHARLLATLETAHADAGNACFESKYHDNRWRPFTAMPSSRADNGAGAATSVTIGPFGPAQALTRMWRASFEHGVCVGDPNPIEDQVAYLFDTVLPGNEVRVATVDGQIVGFLAANPQSIAQLHVRVDHIGRGIGGRLLRLAQQASSGSLWLYTFARNVNARGSYEHHGFVALQHGFEPTWQLADVKYLWVRQPGAGAA